MFYFFHKGHPDSAVLTSLNLRRYEDILLPESVYCLIALTAISAKAYAIASKAFMKLESIPTVSSFNDQWVNFNLNLYLSILYDRVCEKILMGDSC